MKIKVSKKDVIWNYAGVIASLGSNLLMLPIVLYFLTGAQVGLWYVFRVWQVCQQCLILDSLLLFQEM